MHASHSCIVVTEPSENEPVEPAESVEPEPGVQFVVEPEVNQGKQLNMIPCSYLISHRVMLGLYIRICTYCIFIPTLMHCPSLKCLTMSLPHVSQLIT